MFFTQLFNHFATLIQCVYKDLRCSLFSFTFLFPFNSKPGFSNNVSYNLTWVDNWKRLLFFSSFNRKSRPAYCYSLITDRWPQVRWYVDCMYILCLLTINYQLTVANVVDCFIQHHSVYMGRGLNVGGR
jgi:hypothetical protein